MPLAITGYGRSGTTWVAEMVARLTGGLVLFEPCNPQVRPGPDVGLNRVRQRQAIEDVHRALYRGPRHRFTARTNLPCDLRAATPEDFEAVWALPPVGFKDVSLHSAVPALLRTGHRVAFIVRDPVANVISTLRRPSWWAWGWPGSYHMAMRETVLGPHCTPVLEPLRPYARNARTRVERAAVMWAAANLQGLTDLAAAGQPWFAFERLVAERTERERLCEHLGVLWDETVANAAVPSATVSSTAPVTLTASGREAVLEIAAPVLELIG